MRTPAAAVVVVAAMLSGAAFAAQPYPVKPVRLIVPFTAGGGVDLIGRSLAQKLAESLGEPVIVDNRAGGGGNIGTEMVAKSPPDGYTLLMGYVGNLAINPFLYRKLPYDSRRDFAPISLAATAPNVLVVFPGLPAASVKELVALARAKSMPLNYASAGNGTVGHMVAELFKVETGAQITHIPYKGNGQAIADVLAGQVQIMFAAPGASLQQVRAGRLRALAVASAKRESGMPDIPTFAEAGFPSVEAQAWYGLLAAAGTPAAVVDRLQRETARIMHLADVKERLGVSGYEVVTSTPQQFRDLINADLAKWDKVVKASGARVD